jgi:hypothetical protein
MLAQPHDDGGALTNARAAALEANPEALLSVLDAFLRISLASSCRLRKSHFGQQCVYLAYGEVATP